MAQWKEVAKKDLNLSDADLKVADENLSYTSDFDQAIKGRDLVIEALPEDKKVKNEFFANFDKVADDNTVLATNTSTFLPSEFAEITGRPDKFLAYHFANNIWKNNTAEIMAQSKTNPDLLSDFQQLSK
ncbi:3-hydroxyacyl-CoA dehydrogenase NAD-binding domain-containing protein [Lactobacillus sp. S2-2]|uniref:3-hydroxyacyl-CoA dehydrogenase NAD-binding domain-containing protein n=1 Tax=Lactobacillus sp. S2-2 TaxID=2692917 RepID=UPI001F37619F